MRKAVNDPWWKKKNDVQEWQKAEFDRQGRERLEGEAERHRQETLRLQVEAERIRQEQERKATQEAEAAEPRRKEH